MLRELESLALRKCIRRSGRMLQAGSLRSPESCYAAFGINASTRAFFAP